MEAISKYYDTIKRQCCADVIITAILFMAAVLLATTPCYGRKGIVKRHSKVLEDIFSLSDSVHGKQWHYKGEYYYRGALDLKKKNVIILSTPNRRFYMKGGRELLTEDMGDVDYHQPNLFIRKVRRNYGAVEGYDVAHGYIMDFFNIDIHGPYLLGDHILSPLRRGNAYWYKYRCDSVKGSMVYFSFKRKRRNMQLVDGHFAYDKARHYVTSITFSGRYNFVSFTETVATGTAGRERYWPVRASLSFKYWYYGNDFRGNATYTQRYTTMDDAYTDSTDNHDLTARYALALDTTRVVRDSAYVASHRPVPLTEQDRRIYTEATARRSAAPADTADITTRRGGRTPEWIKTLGSVGEFFFNDYDIMSTQRNRLRVHSPYIGYSGSRGISYRQDVEYTRYMKQGRQWSITPRATYFFKEGEMTGRLRGELLFQPLHKGKVAFEAGLQHITANSNNLYFIKQNSEGEDVVESLDFTDFYSHIDVSREVSNGLELSAGILMHHRRPRAYAKEHSTELGLKSRYRAFAPRITVTYTPGQDYYRVGQRKVTVGSKWPTFVVDYEKGLKNVLGSTSSYGKWEFTASHGFHFTPLHRLIWKVGGGMFTDKSEGDFVQYEYFNNGITAYNWDDDRGGVFQLLDQKYYNNSYHYLRGHVVVESPMIILGNFSTRVVRSERLYVNALLSEGLVPYLEFGYGVSNELLDVSFFGSYIKDEFIKTGLKFSLHIFD